MKRTSKSEIRSPKEQQLPETSHPAIKAFGHPRTVTDFGVGLSFLIRFCSLNSMIDSQTPSPALK
jgi:hypothetical protein